MTWGEDLVTPQPLPLSVNITPIAIVPGGGAPSADPSPCPQGAFAIVELRDPEGRQRALDEPRHFLGGRRLRVRPREHRPFPRTPPRDPPGTPPVPPGLLQALGQAQDVSGGLGEGVKGVSELSGGV